jgi:UDP-4-amino-4,6-dideoxy-N-acetyl-beta-L-altrosamine N-acetyltransferase
MSAEATVRVMRPDDLPQVLAWRNHPDVRRAMNTQHTITPEEHARWFESASRDPARRLLIVESAHGPIGYVQFSGVAPGASCDWGFYAVPGAPAGSGVRLGQAALAFAFGQLDVHKVCGQALGGNAASIRLHEKLGFRNEGILRQQRRIGDTYHDLVCFGLLREEWRPGRSEASA